jgi:Na+/proline symporter
MFLVMTITVVTVVLTLRQPAIGGISGLFSQLQQKRPEHLYWWKGLNLPILFAYLFSFVWIKTGEQNNFENATMYLMPKSDKHARRMVLIPLIGSMIGPLIWTIPPLAATLMFTNQDLVDFAGGRLSQPTETAFVAVAMKVLPVGLIGLLLCTMFGATLTAMDAGVNKSVGVFIRSFYRPVLKPEASEKHLLFAGKVCTLVFGLVIIGTSILVNSGRSKDLFSFMNQVGMSLAIPLWLPLFYGLFFKRTPSWSAAVTAGACFVVVIWTNFILADQIKEPGFVEYLPGFVRAMLGNPETFSSQDQTYFLFATTAICTSVVGTIVFFTSAFFYRFSSTEHVERVEALFEKMRTPVTTDRLSSLSDEPLYRLLGTLCMVYGIFVLALMALPNPLAGRVSFVFIGGIISLGGLILFLVANRKRREVAANAVPLIASAVAERETQSA